MIVNKIIDNKIKKQENDILNSTTTATSVLGKTFFHIRGKEIEVVFDNEEFEYLKSVFRELENEEELY